MPSDKPRPYVCPECRDTENYFGRVVFPDELPPSDDRFNAVAAGGGSITMPPPIICPNHDPKKPVELVEVSK